MIWYDLESKIQRLFDQQKPHLHAMRHRLFCRTDPPFSSTDREIAKQLGE